MGRANERPGTSHVISGPMRGLEQIAPDGANTHTHGDSMTELAQGGRFSENHFYGLDFKGVNFGRHTICMFFKRRF